MITALDLSARHILQSYSLGSPAWNPECQTCQFLASRRTGETVDIFEESELELTKKKTASRRVVKKKVIIYVDDNIIPDPDVTLELGKSISITEAEEEEAARQVHATHARIVTESVPEPAKKKTGSRSTRSVVIQDTPSAPKSKPAVSKLKLKSVQSLTPKEQKVADVMQALKESKKTSKRLPGTRGSSEGTGRIPRVLDESTVVSATSSEGTKSKYSEEDLSEEEEIDWVDSEEDDEKTGKEQVNDDEDEEMLNAKVEDSRKGDAEVSDVAKALKRLKKQKMNPRKLNFLQQAPTYLYLQISSLLDIKIQYEVSHIQSLSVLKVPVSVISEPSVLTPVQETHSAAPVTALPPPSVSTIPPTPLQQSTSPIPSPPIITDALTITTDV
ncbi:hypothetical protein Tco_1031697 [Tanacetum coccineum]|uniref:Uncharacterized protein n=1 Tax=Tanacetum coccineum TaxID=301880 RepID=A0ABQ5GA39_9ASTR